MSIVSVANIFKGWVYEHIPYDVRIWHWFWNAESAVNIFYIRKKLKLHFVQQCFLDLLCLAFLLHAESFALSFHCLPQT